MCIYSYVQNPLSKFYSKIMSDCKSLRRIVNIPNDTIGDPLIGLVPSISNKIIHINTSPGPGHHLGKLELPLLHFVYREPEPPGLQKKYRREPDASAFRECEDHSLR